MNNKNNENSIRKIETNGVEQIPDHERTAGPKDLFRLIFGGANTFATAVLGAFPVLFGLSFQAGALWSSMSLNTPRITAMPKPQRRSTRSAIL